MSTAVKEVNTSEVAFRRVLSDFLSVIDTITGHVRKALK